MKVVEYYENVGVQLLVNFPLFIHSVALIATFRSPRPDVLVPIAIKAPRKTAHVSHVKLPSINHIYALCRQLSLIPTKYHPRNVNGPVHL